MILISDRCGLSHLCSTGTEWQAAFQMPRDLMGRFKVLRKPRNIFPCGHLYRRHGCRRPRSLGNYLHNLLGLLLLLPPHSSCVVQVTEPCRLVCWPKPLDRATMNLSHPEIQRHKSRCAVSRHLLVSKTPSLTRVKKYCSWEVLIESCNSRRMIRLYGTCE